MNHFPLVSIEGEIKTVIKHEMGENGLKKVMQLELYYVYSIYRLHVFSVMCVIHGVFLSQCNYHNIIRINIIYYSGHH